MSECMEDVCCVKPSQDGCNRELALVEQEEHTLKNATPVMDRLGVISEGFESSNSRLLSMERQLETLTKSVETLVESQAEPYPVDKLPNLRHLLWFFTSVFIFLTLYVYSQSPCF